MAAEPEHTTKHADDEGTVWIEGNSKIWQPETIENGTRSIGRRFIEQGQVWDQRPAIADPILPIRR